MILGTEKTIFNMYKRCMYLTTESRLQNNNLIVHSLFIYWRGFYLIYLLVRFVLINFQNVKVISDE